MESMQAITPDVANLQIQAMGVRQSQMPASQADTPLLQVMPPRIRHQNPQPRHLIMAHQGTLASVSATVPRDTDLTAFPEIFTLLEARAGTSP